MQTWSGLDLHFNDNADDVTITFTITNNHTEKALLVEVGEITGTKTNADVSVTADDGSAESVVIPANTGTPSSVEYVVTFSVTDKSQPASITGFSIPISMENYEVPEGYAVTIDGFAYYAVNGETEAQIRPTDTPVYVQEKILLALTAPNTYGIDTYTWDQTPGEIVMFGDMTDRNPVGWNTTYTIKLNNSDVDTYTQSGYETNESGGFIGIILEITEPSTIEITSESAGDPSVIG